ncbi:hypothetical protein QUF70_09285 [Desulfobacterales bacterium HSG17]|nr:hypothetical protein [Desulfobacterales bacterium HSG17]
MDSDDFIDWLDSDDYGAIVWQAIDDIKLAFDGADVDLNERKIIWADGERLSIDQSAEKIKKFSDVDIEILKENIVLWLEMDFVLTDLNPTEMENFEEEIYKWINDYKSEHQ